MTLPPTGPTTGAQVIGFGPATGRLEAAYLASDAAQREGAL
jgi:ABC-2 type transport system ATP-binding protein